MRYLAYFTISGTVFFILWCLGLLLIRSGELVASSGSTIIAFVLGGFFWLGFLMIIVWLWDRIRSRLSLNRKAEIDFRVSKRNQIDNMLDAYIDAIKNTRSLERIEYYSNWRKNFEQTIDEQFKKRGLKRG